MRGGKFRIIIIGMLITTLLLGIPVKKASGLTASGAIDGTAIDEYVIGQMEQGKIQGMAVSILYGDEVLYQNYYGSAGDNREITGDTPFGIGSVGKTFTALAIRQLINAGKLKEYALVSDYIKGFQPEYEGEAADITIRQLLTHTSGISQVQGGATYLFNASYSIEEVVDKSKDLFLDYKPGSQFVYSNLNYVILGRVIEIVSGQEYSDYINQNIFQPLQMTHSFFDEKQAAEDGLSEGYVILYGMPVRVHYPVPVGSISAGYVFCSVEDMSHYLISILNQGYYEGKSVIKENPLALQDDPMQNGYLNGWYDEIWLENYGNPKSELYLNSYGYNGAAPNYTSSIRINQKDRYAVVVMNNTMDENDFYQGDIDSSTICDGIMEYLVTGTMPPGVVLKGRYERLLPAVLIILLLITYSFLSIRSALRRRTDRVKLRSLSFLLSDLLLPLSAFFLIPLYNDCAWSWLIAVWPEGNYLIIGAIGWLLLTGIIKLLIRLIRR